MAGQCVPTGHGRLYMDVCIISYTDVHATGPGHPLCRRLATVQPIWATGDGSGIQLTWSCRRQCVTITDVRTADASACGRGSATILEIRVLTPTYCSQKLEDVDGRASLKKCNFGQVLTV